MPDPRQTLTAMRRAVADTPFEVIPLDGGCVVTLALGDERWWPLYARVALRRTYAIEVLLDPAAGTAVTQESQQSVSWRGPAPYPAGPLRRESARMTRYRPPKRVGMRLDGSIGAIDDYRALHRRLRSLVQGTLRECGWRLRLPADIRIAVWVGVGVAALAAVVGLVALLLTVL